MKNKGVFCAFSALLGVLAVFQSFALPIFLLGLLLLFLQKRKKYHRKELALVLLIFFLFLIRAEIEEMNVQTNLSGKEKTFELSLNELGTIDGDKLTLTAEERHFHEKLVMKYRIKSEEEHTALKKYLTPGLICRMQGTLERPQSSTNENSFNYKTYLERKHIYWLLEPEKFNLENCQRTKGLLSGLKGIRAKGISYLEEHFPEEAVPLSAALLFGTSELMDEDMLDSFRELGIVHLIAISGLHITILVTMIYFLLLRLGVTREKGILLLFICLPIYGILAGASPSVNRSVLMTMLLLFCSWRKDRQRLLDVISLTFLLYVFVLPNSIYDVGFQLSFLATYAILLSAPIILTRYTHPVSLGLAVSYISMICTAPVLLYFFFEFSFISLLVNLLYIPLFNLVLLPYVFFGFLFDLLFPGLAGHLLMPLNSVIIFMNHLTEKIASLPWNTLVLGRPEPPFLLLYIWGFLMLFVLWEAGHKGKWRTLLFLLPFLLFASQYAYNHFSLEGEITFLDVGQGDCIFIKLPFGRGIYLIDTGGNIPFEQEPWQIRKSRYDTGKDTVVPFLKSKGVTVIDKLIITHGDQDHAGGAPAVLKEVKVKELVLPDVRERNDLVNRMIQLAKKQQIPLKFVHDGERWKSGDYLFQIISPEADSTSEGNDGSIVLFAEIGGLKWLFTGDLEEEGEARLMRKYPALKADVLKAGHHGSHSSTSEAFVAQLSPHIAVISVGKHNRYGHPSEEVIERLSERKIKILRTDLSGAITYTFEKELGTFSVHHP
ncbi:DNA internalization-related competence protein ComEC/Rec2 [Bacillus benzoevorans]|uniref:Competence protein ComEC n=1 Tax=Bacillus benzoevorans TaxID=1456 RepID=A0A7X0LVW7_9BACI|nr:DNA internalization-related competence protein ComEC/Rec2 [Bacillus benzoevorans]MBB6445960.1 competence protein ComEC [Bacillus benzoevorans]